MLQALDCSGEAADMQVSVMESVSTACVQPNKPMGSRNEEP